MTTKANPPSASPRLDLLRRSLYLPLGLVAVYLTFFFALLTPYFQRHFIFLHAIQFPLFPSYSQPSKYGLAPFKTRPFHLATNDGERIGAWHVLPEVYYQSHISSSKANTKEAWTDKVYEKAMREYPTILYLHGNSMNRAAPWRIAAYSALTSRIDANVIAIDYRGFGDSSGTPSEQGLVEDANAAYRWIRAQQKTAGQEEKQASPSITVFGQSLGTGITALLAAQLERNKTPVEGTVLMAPYTDLKALVKDFRIGGLLPVLAPIGAIPFNNYILNAFLKTHLNTLDTLPNLTATSASHKTNIVLLHATDDPVIPVHHSHRLFDNLLSHSPAATVQERDIHQYARVKRFTPSSDKQTGTVTLIETQHGGHNQLTEGALDLVRLALKLPSHLSP
ncbi:uncharacterized protein UTRI_02215_B [Ustilago trichophora]|uniref:AB hydrolase-1 domain-containing protein n=1 Tax=Ustilago trichophora TaxID=86804 RepID=A0A5C3DYB5_9BASI|nr:uncharacterized protein UTRI_02215_B [Ustilago trichophora]